MEEFIRPNTELKSLQAQIAEQKWVNKRCKEIIPEIQLLEMKVGELQTQSEKEQKDVQKLEGLSLEGLFYALLGSKEQQLEKERQEALMAQLQYDEAHRSLELLLSEKVSLENRMQNLEEIIQIFDTKLETKLALLLKYAHPSALDIKNQHTQLQTLESQKRETYEAIESAKQYQEVLLLLIGQLESSSKWGTWDLMGGGMLASYVKQQRLSDARQTVSSLRYYGQKLEKELADIKQTYSLEVNMSSMEHFVDIFFDNLWVDWMIQQRISQSLGSARLIRSQLHQLIMDLSEKYAQLTHKIANEEDALRLKIIDLG